MLKVTNDNFQEVLESEKPVLIDFFAEWCEPCRVMMPHLEELESESDSICVCKADVDSNDVLCSKYRISSVPTVILFLKGKEINRSVGLLSKSDLINMVESIQVD